MRNHLAVFAGESVLRVSRRLGRGGTSLPGMVALRIQPSILGELARNLPRGAIIITGTNGKTTTAALLSAALQDAGLRLVHNRAGANLLPGLASAFLEARVRGPRDADLAILEVDEATVLDAVKKLRPSGLIVTNFFRDQLDRFGELDTTVALVGKGIEAMEGRGFVVLNADDPIVASLGRRRKGKVIYYGIEDAASGTATSAETREQRNCLVCGRPLVYDTFYYGHLGHYRCPAGDFARPAPTLTATDIRSSAGRGMSFILKGGQAPAAGGATPGGASTGAAGGTDGSFAVELPVPGLYNVYNGLAALTAATELGLPLERAADAVRRARPSFGRMESIEMAGREVVLALVKNPAGFNQVLRTLLAQEPGPMPRKAGWGQPARPPGPPRPARSGSAVAAREFLIAINDKYADGEDVSWLWDVDFEVLAAPGAGVAGIVASGVRAWDMTVRLKYAGVAPGIVTTVPDLGQALDRALAAVPEGGTLFVTPTYTAMLELRDIISRRGYAPQFWEDEAL